MKATVAAVALCLGASASSAAGEVRIGVGAPLSGPDAIFGNQVRTGVDQAVGDLNEAGGLLGQRLKVSIGDDGDDPGKAATVARRFVAEHVSAIIGHFSSAATVAASAIYADAGALDVTPSAMAPLVTERGLPTVFRTCGRDDEQADVAVRYLLQRRFGRIALVHDRSPEGKRLVDSVRKLLVNAGVHDVYFNGIDKETKDLGELVNRLKASNAQVVFFGGAATQAGLLARQIRDANARLILMGGDALASDDFAARAGNAADGTAIVFPKDPKSRPAAASLLRRLRDKGVEPGAYVFYAYAAVQVVAQAAKRSGSLDPARIAADLHSGRAFDTVLGSLRFDGKGDPIATDFTVYVWHKGPAGRLTFDEGARS